MKHAAKKVVGTIPALESSAYPGISPADAAGLQDDASSALCEAMGELGIKPEVCNKTFNLLAQEFQGPQLYNCKFCLLAICRTVSEEGLGKLRHRWWKHKL